MICIVVQSYKALQTQVHLHVSSNCSMLSPVHSTKCLGRFQIPGRGFPGGISREGVSWEGISREGISREFPGKFLPGIPARELGISQDTLLNGQELAWNHLRTHANGLGFAKLCNFVPQCISINHIILFNVDTG